MKRTIVTTTTYTWWRTDGNKVKPSHMKALEETAVERIQEMVSQGFVEGELYDNIHMTDKDPEDGLEYRGWWKQQSIKS